MDQLSPGALGGAQLLFEPADLRAPLGQLPFEFAELAAARVFELRTGLGQLCALLGEPRVPFGELGALLGEPRVPFGELGALLRESRALLSELLIPQQQLLVAQQELRGHAIDLRGEARNFARS